MTKPISTSTSRGTSKPAVSPRASKASQPAAPVTRRAPKSADSLSATESPAATPGTRKRRTPEDARSSILAAAAKLFAERGPDAVGIKDIAAAVGVSHSLVIHYFGSFDALVRAVLLQRNQQIRSTILQRITQADAEFSARDLLALAMEVLGDDAHARLLAWTALTNQTELLHEVQNEGPRALCDLLETKAAMRAAKLGKLPPTRSQLELTMLVALSAIHGYAVGKKAFVPGLGLPLSRETDDAFVSALGEMLRMFIHSEPRS